MRRLGGGNRRGDSRFHAQVFGVVRISQDDADRFLAMCKEGLAGYTFLLQPTHKQKSQLNNQGFDCAGAGVR